jgi:hypothetical protein
MGEALVPQIAPGGKLAAGRCALAIVTLDPLVSRRSLMRLRYFP